MGGTRLGGMKCADKIREIHGVDFWKKIGKIGGSKRTEATKRKGFGTNRYLASIAGRKGGTISRRKKKND